VSEKLRMSVGLKINDDISLNLLFLENSLPFLGKLAGSDADSAMIMKSLDMMTKLGVTIYAEKGNYNKLNFLDDIKPHFFEMREFEGLINKAKRIIS
jgi:hypothetical protein